MIRIINETRMEGFYWNPVIQIQADFRKWALKKSCKFGPILS